MKLATFFVAAWYICFTVAEQMPYCNLRIAQGPCKEYTERYAAVNGFCKRFTYSGCGGNLNNFLTLKQCRDECGRFHPVCDAPIEPGNCKQILKRFGNKNGHCEEFIYTGCGGNANNFQTMKECRNSCHFLNPVCDEPIKSGPCKSGHHEVYGFDSKSGQCKMFSWGGCQHNDNLFSSMEDCQATCLH